jgi:hypothetical protein
MRKFIMVFLALSIFFLASCNEVDPKTEVLTTKSTSEQNSLSEQSNVLSPEEQSTVFWQNTQSTQSSAPFTIPETGMSKQILAVSAKLAKLTKEDGTGEIYIGISPQDAMKILDRHEIPYIVDRFENGSVAGLDFEDGTTYFFADIFGESQDDMGLCDVYQTQTYRGIKMGDPLSKVKEVYKDQITPEMEDNLQFIFFIPIFIIPMAIGF